MKLLPLIKQIISEVGEGTAKPYGFSIVYDQRGKKGNVAYRLVSFTTEDGDKYEVSMSAFWGDSRVAEKFDAHLTIDFGIKEGGFLDTDTVVSKGRLFKVMATIVKIARDFMDDLDYKEKGINTLRILPTKTEGEFDDRRANLYMAYIKRQLPISDINYDGDEIVATIKWLN